MKCHEKLTVAGAAVLAVVAVCTTATAQTKVDMRSQARNIDFSAASSTRPFPVGTALPALCTQGETFFKANAPVGENLYLCTATNIWTAGAGASLPVQSGNTGRLLGTNGTSASWRTFNGFVDDGSRFVPDGSILAKLDANNVWTGHQRYPASPAQVLTAETSKIMCNRRTIALTAAAEFTLTSAATIPDGADGQVCVIVNIGSSAITIQDQDTLAGSNLQLNASRITIPAKGQLTLQYNSTIGDWIQEGIAGASGSGTIIASGLQDTGGSGLVAQTGANGLTAARTILGANGIAVSNGDGISGNPLISLPGTTKGDLIVHNGITNTRVPAGTNGQTLVADPAQPAGVKWSSRSIAGANGLSVTNGDWSAGNAVSVTMPGTTKGDLIVHNGITNTRVPVGLNGQVLAADSSEPAGVKWVIPGGSGSSSSSVLVPRCYAPGTSTSTYGTSTLLGSVNLTGLAPGGVIRYSARFTAENGLTIVRRHRVQLGGEDVLEESGWNNVTNATGWLRGEIALMPSNVQFSSALFAYSNAVNGGMLAGSGGRSDQTTVDISSGSVTLGIYGGVGTSNTGSAETITLRHLCVEYVPPMN
jgi:hypothetical protein